MKHRESARVMVLLAQRPHPESQEVSIWLYLMLAPIYTPMTEDWTTHWDRGPARKKEFHSPRPGQAGSMGNMTSLGNGLCSSKETEPCGQGER